MAFSSLALISAAYQVQGSHGDWLQNVLDALGPGLDRGLGVYGYLADLEVMQVQPSAMRFYRCNDYVREFALSVVPVPPQDFAKTIRETMLAHPAGCSSQIDHPIWQMMCEALLSGPTIWDTIGICAFDSSGNGCAITVPVADRSGLSPQALARLERVSAHVASGHRLRRQLEQRGQNLEQAAEAVFDRNGRLLHRTEQCASGLELLTLAVHHRAVLETRPDAGHGDALRTWTALVEGEWSIVDWLDRDGKRFYVACVNRPELRPDRRLTARQRQIVAYLGLGHRLKLIAYELGIGETAVAEQIRAVCIKLGVAHRLDLVRLGRQLCARVPDPVPTPSEPLSTAEQEVVTMAERGLSDREIATARGTSVRTIANQLRSAYRRLGVSSRTELVARQA